MSCLNRKKTEEEIRERNWMAIEFPAFDPETYPRYGVDEALYFEKRPVKRHAVRMDMPGKIETREGIAAYGRGDWIVTDEQGGKYPVHDSAFRRLYFVPEDATSGCFKARPRVVCMFRTDRELEISTEWGDYKADKGDWVVLNDDGTLGCPVKPDAVKSGYKLELPAG